MNIKKEEIKVHFSNVQFVRGFSTIEGLNHYINNQDFGFCFVGRSNVGKSSLINAIFGKKTARTSKTPGRTQEINVFSFIFNEKKFFFYDLPGYGFANVPLKLKASWNILIANFFENLSHNILLINIQDARHPLQKSDLSFLEMLKLSSNDKFLCLNKYDKLKTQKDRHVLNKTIKNNLKQLKWSKQIFQVSATSNYGLPAFILSLESFLERSNLIASSSEYEDFEDSDEELLSD